MNNSSAWAEVPSGPDPWVERLWAGYILTGLCAVGLIGNCLNLTVIGRRAWAKTSRGQGNKIFKYLFWLAVADIMFLAASTYTSHARGWDQGQSLQESLPHMFYFIHLHQFTTNTFLATIAYIIVLVTAERYLAICHPLKAQTYPIHRYPTRLCAAGLVFSLVVNLPQVFQLTLVHARDSNNVTYWYSVSNERAFFQGDALYAFKLVHSALTKFIPIAIIIGFNAVTAFKFRQQSRSRLNYVTTRRRPFDTPALKGSASKEKRQQAYLVAMLLITAVVHVVCVVPAAIAFILYDASPHWFPGHDRSVVSVTNVIEAANSALNFYCYTMCSAEFRRDLWRTLAGRARTLGRGFTSLASGGRNKKAAPKDRRQSPASPTSGSSVDGTVL